MTITQTPQPAVIRPKRRIASFDAMVVLEENAEDNLTITKHPVQEGSTVSDNAFIEPSKLSIKALFNDNQKPLDEIYQALLKLQASKIPFDVVTGKRIYKNMMLTSLGNTTDKKTENILSISFTIEEIIIAQVEIVTVPPRSKQKSPGRTGATQKAGTKSAEAVNKPQKQQSILSSARTSRL